MNRNYLQHGGDMPVYRGMPYQYGNGLGNILMRFGRFIFPFLAPIATAAATKFVTTTSDNLKEGKTLKESAKEAIGPTVSGVVSTTSQQVLDKINQKGSGRKRRRATRKKRNSRKTKRVAKTQTGGRKRRVYKGTRKRRHSQASNTHSTAKKLRFLNNNF